MKKHITLIFLLISLGGFAQKRFSDRVTLDKSYKITFMQPSPGITAMIKNGSDTLEILDLNIVKFIKLGGKVYRVKTDLEEIKPTTLSTLYFSNQTYTK